MQPITSVDALLTYLRAGHSADYLFFWGHQQPKDGRITQSCLSNWYPATFTVDEIVYPSTEHYMMARKALLFDDRKVHDQILSVATPKEAKALGRRVHGFDDATWNAHRVEVMVTGNQAKFAQNAPLKEYLLSTSDKVLVEASPVDNIWGIGMAADDPNVRDPALWKGLNLLGFALMIVRDQLQER